MATELENLVPEADVEVEGMRGPKGEKGDSYVLTEADKEEIAQKVDKIIDAETDKTLTLSGKPADAKAAGDEINDIKADLSENVDDLKSAISELGQGYEVIDYTRILNEGLNRSDGTFPPENNWERTDYVPVIGGETLYVDNSLQETNYNGWYTSDKTYIRYFTVPQGTNIEMIVPDNAGYAVFTHSHSKFAFAFRRNVQCLATKAELNSDISEIQAALGYDSNNNFFNGHFTDGYYSSGVWTESSTYETSDFLEVPKSGNIYLNVFNLNDGTKAVTAPSFMQWIYWFNSSQTYIDRTSPSVGSLTIPAGAKYCRIMVATSMYDTAVANGSAITTSGADLNSYKPYSASGYPEIIGDFAKCSLASNVYTITTNKAQYVFKKMTDNAINLDTWRLYSCYLFGNEGNFKVWSGSDAEGAIRISGETDFVCGFHGSEVATKIKVFMDGADISSATSFTDRTFKDLAFYVESNVYHCYADADAGVLAFKRCKVIEFKGDTVRISNSFIAQSNLNILYARLALFSCDKENNSQPFFTNYSVNTDFKIYSVANYEDSHPTESEKMTEAELFTKYRNIRFKSLMTSGQKYTGIVENLSTRLKVYFDTIHYDGGTTAIVNGEQLLSQFEFEIV